VLGDGPLGLVMVQVMSRLNASVRLIGRHADKLAICEKWGVKHRLADEVGRRDDQDVVVDAPAPTGLSPRCNSFGRAERLSSSLFRNSQIRSASAETSPQSCSTRLISLAPPVR
jgi:hypothetical protein